MNILLVEPDHYTAQLFGRYLAQAGYAVQHQTTAQAAITAADSCKPDLVIVEPQLTNHSGIEFMYEFRSYDDWRFVPVVVVSSVPPAAFEGSQAIMKQRLGVRSYHYKPTLTLRQLGDAVQAALP